MFDIIAFDADDTLWKNEEYYLQGRDLFFQILEQYDIKDPDLQANYIRAFKKNSRWYRPLLNRKPAGWGRGTQRRLAKVLEDTNTYIQKLNDMFTNPSGSEDGRSEAEPPAAEQTPAPGTSANPDEEPDEKAAPEDETEPRT